MVAVFCGWVCLSHLPEVDLLTFEFPPFGPFLVMAAKGESLISGSFGQVMEFFGIPPFQMANRK